MADVRLEKVRKVYADAVILRDVDLQVRDGEFVVFVGPSGCGKSTLLRTIAGLETIDGGTLSIGGRVVNDVPPAERGIAMVFQSYALYPHMTLFDNMAFGLQIAKVPKAEIERSVRAAARTLHIEHLLDRLPRDLSGGQRQRVAIGRAIVRQPEVFLFDEPLSNLDTALRVKMRYEFARLHEQLGTTMVYVTHDQVEAMTLADRIVVLSAGRVEQVGSPIELYEHPANLFVAGFIGSPAMNRLPGTVSAVQADVVEVTLGTGERLLAHVDPARRSGVAPGQSVTLGVRPEHLVLADAAAPHTVAATVRFVESLGGSTQVYATGGGASEDLTCTVPGHRAPRPGEAVRLAVPPQATYLFDGEGRALPRPRAAEDADAA